MAFIITLCTTKYLYLL